VGRLRPGAIILLHNAPYVTIDAIPEIVRGLRAKGYTLVTMSELVQRARRDPLPRPTPAVTASRKASLPEVASPHIAGRMLR